MKVSGSYTLDAPRQVVWEALNDMEILARIVPGCQRLEQTGENEYEGTLKIGIQAIKGTYTGKIRLQDIQPPSHYKLIANGRSSNGVIDGVGSVDLEEQDGKTVLKYGGDADIGGTLASVGQRLIEGASRQLINQSLKALAEQIRQRTAPDDTTAGDTAATEAAASETGHSVTVDSPVEATGETESTQTAMNGTAHPTEDVLVAAPSGATAATPASKPLPAGTAAPVVQPPEPPQHPIPSSPERRTVVVPEHEQLKPESVFHGMLGDFISERPWMPWVIIAFLLGYILGRNRL